MLLYVSKAGVDITPVFTSSNDVAKLSLVWELIVGVPDGQKTKDTLEVAYGLRTCKLMRND